MISVRVASPRSLYQLLVATLAAFTASCNGDGGVSLPDEPSIGLSETSRSFTATVGRANPEVQTISITNSGGGTLSELVTSVTYQAGQPTGWLSASLSARSAPSTLTLTATTGSLAAGTYNGIVSVSSSVADNSPQTVNVTFEVTEPTAGAVIVLSSTSQSFSSLQGGAGPAPQTLDISNGGGGTLSGLSAAVSYSSGQPTGWLNAGLSSTAAPSVLTLTATTGSLLAGTYTASVAVGSAAATNSPQTVAVTFTIVPPTAGPLISLSTNSRSFSAEEGGSNPPARTVEVTNAGGGTLSGLAAQVTYGSGQPTGWLNAGLSATTAPGTLTLTATTGSLAAGTYNATVAVSSPVADNSPQEVVVTFNVTAPTAGAVIMLSSSSQNFGAVEGGGDPQDQTVEITNAGAGTLTGLAANVSYAAGQPAGWLDADLNRTTAPSTLTLAVTTGTLAAGTYTASVAVTSTVASNSPQSVTVTFTVEPPAVSPEIVLSRTTVEFTKQVGEEEPEEETVEVTSSTDSPVAGLGSEVTYTAGEPTGWLTDELSQEATPSTLRLSVTSENLTPATYHATVQVSSSAAGVSPKQVTVSLTIAVAPPTAPSELGAAAVSSSRIDLTWTDDSSDEEGFRIERCTGEGCTDFAEIATVGDNVNTYENAELSASTTYRYQVRAYNSAGPSAYSNIAGATTLSAWTILEPMPTRRYLAVSGVVGGKLYVVGGLFGDLTVNEEYDPLTNTWSAKEPMPTPRRAATAAVVDGILYVIGGSREGIGELTTVEAYDPETNTWETKEPMPTARDGAMAGVVDGIIYVAGGTGAPGTGYLTTVEAYDPEANAWTTKAPLSVGRQNGASGVVNGIFYVAGGDAGGSGTVTTEAYDPTSNMWTTKKEIPTQRARVAAGVLDGILYVAGGVLPGPPTDPVATVEAYDPATDEWATIEAMPTPREFPAGGVVNGVFYVVGGRAATGEALGTLEGYRP